MSDLWRRLSLTVHVADSFMSYSGDEEHECENHTMHLNLTTQKSQAYLSDETLLKTTFALGNVLIPIVSLLGTLGNIFSLIVLRRNKIKNASNACLAAMACSDLLFLLHSLLFSCLAWFAMVDEEQGLYYRSVLFPVFGAFSSPAFARITSWLTLLLGVERLIAVCFPIRSKVMCSRFFSTIVIAFIYISTVLLFLPYAMKYRTVYGCSNSTGVEKDTARVDLTELGRNKQFFNIYGTTMNILFRFLPVIILIVLNTIIVIVSRKTWKMRRAMNTMSKGTAGSRDQLRFTAMLVTVCVVFIICIIPGAIHSLLSRTMREYSRRGKYKNLFMCISNVTFFLETFNSSINFVIYMAMSQKFKRTYKEIFTCQKRPLAYVSSLNSQSRDISPLMGSKRSGRNSSNVDMKTSHSLVTIRKISRDSIKQIRG